MLLLDRPSAAPDPEQGVIEEARRRRHRRLLLSGAGVLAALATVVGAAALGSRRATPPHPAVADPPPGVPGAPRQLPVAAALRRSPLGVLVRVTPNLEGTQAGWCVQVIAARGESGTCGLLPTPGTPILSGSTGWGNGERFDTTVLVTSPEVASVAFADGRRVSTVGDRELPYGLRVALLRTRHRPGPPAGGLEAVETAYDRAGRVIPVSAVRGSGLSWRIWNPPAAPSPGACALAVTGGYPARALWGQVAAALRPYPARVLGRGFVSCIDTEYQLPGARVRASVLLDASSPARAAPAPIPGLAAVPGLPGFYETDPEYGFESLLARREGDTWLVAAGGAKDLKARARLLAHLRVSVAG